jgi:hypothetical protein
MGLGLLRDAAPSTPPAEPALPVPQKDLRLRGAHEAHQGRGRGYRASESTALEAAEWVANEGYSELLLASRAPSDALIHQALPSLLLNRVAQTSDAPFARGLGKIIFFLRSTEFAHFGH